MTKRLKEVVNRLYKPTLNTHQVFTLSRGEAEQLPQLPSVAVISITTPGRPLAMVDGFEHVLRLSFADVDFMNRQLSKRAKAKISTAFTSEQASQIRNFIDGLPKTINSLVIHCEGGYSRSCAIALGLHKLYGYVVESERLENANPSVLKVLLETDKPLKRRK